MEDLLQQNGNEVLFIYAIDFGVKSHVDELLQILKIMVTNHFSDFVRFAVLCFN